MSPIAMVLADWVFHRYLQVYAPSLRSLSFVDNLAFIAPTPGLLMHGYALTGCYCEMLDLELDLGKTFVWSTSSTGRRALKCQDLPVVLQARELGGILSYSQANRNALLVQRCRAMAPLWDRLRRSKAPAPLKLAILPGKFWPKALHGICGCPLGVGHLQQLRSAAVKATGLNSGGSNPLLRLSLASNMEVDPGFYELWHSVQALRRMLVRQPQLLFQWRTFMTGYDGDMYHGPFSKLLQLFSRVGWSVLEPPQVMDHDGLVHDLVASPQLLLRRLLEQAWLMHVGQQVSHRATMSDAVGLDLALLSMDQAQLTPLELALQSSLRSGAFMFGAQQAKFDLSQDGLCPHCQVEDNAHHRVCVCPNHAAARKGLEWICDLWPQLPRALTHHLLPSRNTHMGALHQRLLELPDSTSHFQCRPAEAAVQHLFTDGACEHFGHSTLALAAWGLVLGGSCQVVACGPLPGILQTAPRAELTAMLAALKWVLRYQCVSYIWVDAKNVVTGVQACLDGLDHEPTDNLDLWQQVKALLDQLPHTLIKVFHVPSHLSPGLTASPFEDWVAEHNGHVDSVAGLANQNRSVDFVSIHNQAVQFHQATLAQIRALRTIYFRLARSRMTSELPCPEMEEAGSVDQELTTEALDKAVDLEHALQLNWHSAVMSRSTFPSDFVYSICDFLFTQDSQSTCAYRVTWLEFVFMLELGMGLEFPVSDQQGRWCSAKSVVFRPAPPTVARRLHIVRDVAKSSLRALGLEAMLVSGLDLIGFGISYRLDGFVGGVDPILLLRARARLASFCGGRNMRSSAALARPL